MIWLPFAIAGFGLLCFAAGVAVARAASCRREAREIAEGMGYSRFRIFDPPPESDLHNLHSSARPSGVITVGAGISDTEVSRLRERWGSAHR